MTTSKSEDEDIIYKNWVWVPNDQDLFTKGYITDYLEDGKCKVNIVSSSTPNSSTTQSTIVIEQSKLENCNPSKFDKCNDMAELTHLNEPSVVYNLYLRYLNDLIYTYSGLFLVAINPYKSLPIYNETILKQYNNSSLNSKKLTKNQQLPPHIFAIAENTLQNLLSNKKDQSILVTGESGAGKTENTKKVIQYLSSIVSLNNQSNNNNSSSQHHHQDIDDKILQANPILESFGNAKTIKNNNSSRFGKFIKIYFNEIGELTGANIDYYLLEKSRVVNQSKNERNYHIFYHFLKGYENLTSLGLNKDLKTYSYLNGTNDIENINDFKEFNLLVEAFKIVGFNSNEIQLIYEILAVILHLGNLKFNSHTAEQASFTKDSPIEKIANLLGIKTSILSENLLKPKVKAGKEFITKSKKSNEVKFSIDAFAKYLYEKLFQFIINKINKNLNINDSTTNTNDNFIGVLDIAGFEIFEKNSFEQLCINYTNEKLQQFFNHHSFILEQSEYLRENIQWEFIDFGKDLQPTIDLIETRSPMGILKLLDEECMMPKSSDKEFMLKLSLNFNGKNANNKHKKFLENKYKNGFIIKHYAGEVEYNVDNWLQKNTDPINENLIQLLSTSSNQDIVDNFIPNDSSSTTTNGTSQKLKTASQKHKDQLKNLMDQLESTEPHFVRCILPNLDKKFQKFDKNLVLNQLRCNGVLEGIRITRAGYPNKLIFQEFNFRYSIIYDKFQFTKNEKTNVELILKESGLNQETYKIGLTKIFFKNGILGKLEAMRDLKLKHTLTQLQKVIRGNLIRKDILSKIKKLQSSQIIAKTMQTIENSQKNPWIQLFYNLKPLLEDSIKVYDSKEIQDNLNQMTLKFKESENSKNGLSKDNENLKSIIKNLEDDIISNNQIIKDKDNQLIKFRNDESKSLKIISELESKIKSLKETNQSLTKESSMLTNRLKELHDKHETKSNELELNLKNYNDVQSELKSLQNQYEEFKSNNNDEKLMLKELQTKHEKTIVDHDEKVVSLQNLIESLKENISSRDNTINELNKKLNSNDKSLKDDKSKQVLEIDNFKNSISQLNQDKSKQLEEIELLKSQIKSNDLKKSKYEDKIEEAKEKVSTLKAKVDTKTNEINQYKKEIKELKSQLISTEAQLQKYKEKEFEISEIKSNETKHLKELETLQNKYSQIISDHNQLNNEFTKIKSELERSQKAKNEYTSTITKLNNQISDLQEAYRNIESEKENLQPNPQFMDEYTHMKLKLNEQNALLRKEKFENKKLIEELQLIKERVMNGSLLSNDITPKRRSLAIGERINSNINTLNKEINDLKLKLQQEQANYQRAENYAIELQKKLNKLESSRGLNNSSAGNLDYEKKIKDYQNRINQLENKIEGLISIDSLSESSSSSSPNTSLTRSESLGGNSLSFRGVNQDFIQIYQDMNKTLRSTRNELSNCKSEILRLKSLLRESEDELYLVKQSKFKSSMKDYEQNLANLKVKYDNLNSRNQDLIQGLDLYRKRSDEYFKKLELAESAIIISKRQEDQAIKEMNELRSQLRLSKEEARTSQIMLKDSRNKIENLEHTIQLNNSKIEDSSKEINELKDKLSYHIKNYENKESIENLKDEIRNLHKDLNFKTSNETILIKENKQLTLDLEELQLVKKNLTNELEESVLKEEELENKVVELTDKLRILEDSKILDERKITSLNKQITGLKELIQEINEEKNKLFDTNAKLEEEKNHLNHILENKQTEIEQNQSEISFLKLHLNNQKQDQENLTKELNQSKLLSSSEYKDQQKFRNELLISNEENYSLKKTNEELVKKNHELEEKLYSNEQIKYLEDKIKNLTKNLDLTIQEKHESNKIIKNLERSNKTLKTQYQNESKLSKKYNDENFNYQNKINHLKTSLDSLYQENLEKDLNLKNFEIEKNQLNENYLILQKEVLELRERLNII
ncbi:uncharacterized protein KGF55_002119 [Candida pseudojiufengensis]|uniref:uncharacterized protein n=1 Tax=Candida pseudojiufengensis TaxID=497109 RepID=UPI0022246F55|nr:uncharacterized protein KGF55_002119 [Candida pseudojiufengensis]KAI5964177.1 hypothetical protein KGF55_002119 [Candida pseudojiufengensis]